MGVAITWCAVAEGRAGEVLRSMDLHPTGNAHPNPTSPVCCARLGGGWRVVWYNKYACSDLSERNLERLSHQGENGPQRLDVDGSPPAESKVIRQEMEAAQLKACGSEAEVDYLFENPLKVAQVLLPFDHDRS